MFNSNIVDSDTCYSLKVEMQIVYIVFIWYGSLGHIIIFLLIKYQSIITEQMVHFLFVYNHI